ncbi:MAG: hypothetical protein ACT4QF_15225 [Sporichthyaceae bacterium]
MGRPLLKFSSFVNGREAEVTVYEDHIEWEGHAADPAPEGESTGRRAARRAARPESGSLPFDRLSSVTMWRATAHKAVVGVAAAGEVVELRVDHAVAAALANELNRGMLAAAARGPEIVLPGQRKASAAEQVQTLGVLFAAGLLSTDQFETERDELLAQV